MKKGLYQRLVKQKIFLRENRFFFLSTLFLLILGDAIFFTISSDIRIFALLGFYLYLAKQFSLKSQTTFLFAFFLFVFTYISYIFTDPSAFHRTTTPPAEKAAVWVFMFLVLGVIQKWRE